MKNVTNRYKLFPVETLKGIWGPCGACHNASGLTADSRLPPAPRTRVTRVGGKPNVVFLGTWGSS